MTESQSLPILPRRPRRACAALRELCPQPLEACGGTRTPGVSIPHTGPPAGGTSTPRPPGQTWPGSTPCRQPRRPPEIPRFTGQALVSGKKNASRLLKRPSIPRRARPRPDGCFWRERAQPASHARLRTCASPEAPVSATGQRREDDPFQSAGEGQRSPGSAHLLVDLFTRSLWPGSLARECWNRPAAPPPPPGS